MDLTIGGGRGADQVTSSDGGADPTTTEQIRPSAARILPRATTARGIGLGGLFFIS